MTDFSTAYYYAVSGTRRHYPDDDLFYATERMKAKHPDAFLVVGDAKGVDEVALLWAKDFGLRYAVEKANWDAEGLAAGHNRNARILDWGVAEVQCYFHERPTSGLVNTSPGTCDMLTQARDRGIKVFARHRDRWLSEQEMERIVGAVHAKWRAMGWSSTAANTADASSNTPTAAT